MKHVIHGVGGALAVLAPFQDGHSWVQVDSQRQSMCPRERERERLQTLEGVKSTLRFTHTFLSSFVFPLFTKRRRCCGACEDE